MNKILLYEELSLNAHPALQTQLYDGWVLRFANGYTKRANSINPLYSSSLDLHVKITYCEEMYQKHGLPVVFKLTDDSDPQIDKMLDERAYEVVEPTYVMSMDINDRDYHTKGAIITDHADEKWLDAYYTFGKYSDSLRMATAKQILDSVKNQMLCGLIIKDGKAVACVSAVIEREHMALLNVVVDESWRGKGYGMEICEALLAEAKQVGAKTAYLQVVQANHVALSLYKKLGYQVAYSYWYRVKY